MKEIFTDIYKHNKWHGTESVSGSGSTINATRFLVPKLEQLFRDLKVKTFLDAPCGDCNWIRKVDLSEQEYIGADIVKDLIAKNTKNPLQNAHSSRFIVADITKDVLPKVDLILCRDCLVHLSLAAIRDALRCFRASKSKYLLTTSFIHIHSNINIPTGKWRPLNLGASPFKMKPLKILYENYSIQTDKVLYLFKL